MDRPALCIWVLVVLCASVFAQDSSYYKAIQKGAPTQVEAKQFKQIEQDALKDYTSAETYEKLATAFENTTEKVWAVIYGEAFCNLSSDSDRTNRIGALVFRLYDKSLSSKGGNLSVNLTENAQVSQAQPPFESHFELSFLMGAVPSANSLIPLSIQQLTAIRKNQLSLWAQKKLPLNELIRRQQAIIAAGHFEAYNYWLFQSARADEFSQWTKEHQKEYQAWLDWQSKNRFSVKTPDFQRLYLIRGRS